MNTKKSKTSGKAFLLLLTALMLSVVMAVTAACGNDATDSESTESSSSATETKPTDTQTVNNGDFEFYTDSSTTYPYYSSGSTVKWTRNRESALGSTFYAPTPVTSYGIIDTADDAYGKLDASHKPADGTNPKTPALEENEETEVNEAGTKVLMIHNKVTSAEGQGTAQYFESNSSLSLNAGEYAKISVWVKTLELTSLQRTEHFGAYVKIKNTVGSSIEPITVKNINTYGKWVNYVFYLAPSMTATTNYKVVLGLGMGTSVNKEELCEGFAYFDNVEFTVIDKDEYDNSGADYTVKLYNAENENVLDEDTYDEEGAKKFTIDETGNLKGDSAPTTRKVSADFAKASKDFDISGGQLVYNAVNPNNEDGNKVSEYPAGYTTDAYSDIATAKSVYMDFRGQQIGSSATYTTKTFNLKAGEYALISFKAKVSARASATKASVVVSDDGNNASSSFDNFTTDGEEVLYNVYVSNVFDKSLEKYKELYCTGDTDNGIPYSLKLSFGPTALTTSVTAQSLPVGYAVFSDFTITYLTESEYSAANTSSDAHAIKTSLKGKFYGEYQSEDEDDEEDDYVNEGYTFSISDGERQTIKTQAVPLSQISSSEYTAAKTNANTVIGTVNSKYADAYTTLYGADLTAALNALDGKQDGQDHAQPLMIYNKDSLTSGVKVNSATLSANTAYKFSVKVRVLGDAKAYIYLVDTSKHYSDEQFYRVSVYTTEKNTYGEGENKNYSLAMATTVDSTATLGDDGYALVTFYIRTGEDELSLRLELWNGSRDGLNKSEGIVLYDFVNSAVTGEYSTFDDLAAEYMNGENDFTVYKYNQGTVYTYVDEYDKEEPEYATDEDGEKITAKAETYVVAAADDDDYDAALVKFYRYDVLDIYNIEYSETEDETASEETSETDEDDEDETAGSVAWLQVTSLIIAGALIAALVAIVIRKLLENNNKKKAKTRSYYTGYDKSTSRRKYSAKGSKQEIEAPEDTDEDYNYDDPENN